MMSSSSASNIVIAALIRQMESGKRPFLVAIDGGSGAGKSTLAAVVASKLNAVVIPSDDFYSAHISDTEWDRRTPAQRYTDAINWHHLRSEALEPLLKGNPAKWYPFDFANRRSDGSYPMSSHFVERQPGDLIILEGAYTTRPELQDLIDFSILIDVPARVRHQRLSAREDADFLSNWHARWDAVEGYYFEYVRPPSAFDLVIAG